MTGPAPWLSASLLAVQLAASAVLCTASHFVITKDDGRTLQDVRIDNVAAFLEFANLDASYAEPLEAEGLVLDDLAAVTDMELDAMGVKKLMHRSRFLRFAQQLRVVADAAPNGGAAKAKAKEKPRPKPSAPDPRQKEAAEVDNLEVTRARWDAADAKRKAEEKDRLKAAREPSPDLSAADEQLAIAVEGEDVEAVDAALAAGANINMYINVDGDGQTPLMYSSLAGLVEVAQALLSHNADMDLGMLEAGFTPLHGAAFQGQPAVVKLLLEHGADPLHRHQDGFIPMHRACWGTTPRHTEAVLLFLEAGVPVLTSAKDPDESTKYDLQDGMMTPLNMSSTNPMTIALLREWEASGHKPTGDMGDWGQDAFDDEYTGHDEL